MQTTSPLTGIFQFGVFQLDLKAGELHKAGVRVRLQDQPFRVLAVLVEHAGQLVTREDLRQRVWPSHVCVDFDQGLNNAIKKVREALGDSADNPRLIETYKRSAAGISAIGKELHADYLVQGSVRRAQDRVRISVHLIQVSDQTERWAESYDRDLKDILALQDSIARTIANQINIRLTPEQTRRLANRRGVEPDAYTAYLKGRYYWNKRTAEGMQKAQVYFQQAIDEDPGYGAAYSGLADCNSGLTWHGFTSPADTLPKAHAAALKAIEIDPLSAEAHASLALELLHEWDWPRAEAEFRHALQLDPRYANAHHWYGDYLSITGQHTQAQLEAQTASDLDPLNLMIGTWLAQRYYFAHKYENAVRQARSTVELDPNFAASHLLLGEAYVQMGLHEQGLAELQTAASLSGNSPLYVAQVAVAYASQGRRAEALQVVAQLRGTATQRYVSPYGIAQIYATLKDQEQTFKWLQTAYDGRAVWMSYLAVDPVSMVIAPISASRICYGGSACCIRRSGTGPQRHLPLHQLIRATEASRCGFEVWEIIRYRSRCILTLNMKLGFEQVRGQ